MKLFCKADGCTQALTGRQREFCSDKCRKRTSRTKPGPEDAPESTNADKVVVERGQSEVGQRTRTVLFNSGEASPTLESRPPWDTGPVGQDVVVPVDWGIGLVPGGIVYGRQAVSYPHDRFSTRPEPLDPTDKPDPMNRCIYMRVDGTRYLLDATGNQHERPQAAGACL